MKERKIVSGYRLKLIAMFTMLIDHITVVLVSNDHPYYLIGRIIGRLAFPIFCFLIIEGFLHTNNIKKYLSRLLIFAFISEIPFDLAFYEPGLTDEHKYHQNIYFTLFLGLLTIALIHNLDEYFKKKGLQENLSVERVNEFNLLQTFLNIFVLLTGCLVAYFLNTDYSFVGVLMIWGFYKFKNDPKMLILCMILLNSLYGLEQMVAILSLFLIKRYNGQRGPEINKFIFYGFYPIHLLFLYLIKTFL